MQLSGLIPAALRDRGLARARDLARKGGADSDALDLTARALGMALQLDLKEKVAMTLLRPRATNEEGSSGSAASSVGSGSSR